MLYFDTSFLAPLILQEATSAAIETFIAALTPGTLAVSHWTRVEFSSLLAREVRMGGMGHRNAQSADAEFEAVIRESFVVYLPDASDYDRAKAYLATDDAGLRAGDALHLAIAHRRKCDMIYSLDHKLVSAGKLLGLPVSMGP